jgi:hypothetical protein
MGVEFFDVDSVGIIDLTPPPPPLVTKKTWGYIAAILNKTAEYKDNVYDLAKEVIDQAKDDPTVIFLGAVEISFPVILHFFIVDKIVAHFIEEPSTKEALIFRELLVGGAASLSSFQLAKKQTKELEEFKSSLDKKYKSENLFQKFINKTPEMQNFERRYQLFVQAKKIVNFMMGCIGALMFLHGFYSL